MIYLDHNATTAPRPVAVQAVLDALTRDWANPSSMHAPGQAARSALAAARAQVAGLLGCQPADLVFTSGATEANHMAVLGALALGRAQGRKRLLMSAVEHPGLLALATQLRAQGTPVDLIGVDGQGRLDLAQARALLGPDVALLSVMAANNETGVRMPIEALAGLAAEAGVPLHVDATQLVGKGPFHFGDSGIALCALSAHKLGAPKGVGALVLRKGLALPALICGRQERKRRGGTENLPGIAGFGAAAAELQQTLAAERPRLQALRERLEAGLRAAHPAVRVLGEQAERLVNTSCVCFGTLDAERVLTRLERAGVVASSGAACAAGGTEPSHVLLAMGLSPLAARAGVRFSLGRGNDAAQIEAVLAAVQQAIVPLLAEASEPNQPLEPA
jgi:cysteine desulfurase